MRIAIVCAAWRKPLARSVNFSRFMEERPFLAQQDSVAIVQHKGRRIGCREPGGRINLTQRGKDAKAQRRRLGPPGPLSYSIEAGRGGHGNATSRGGSLLRLCEIGRRWGG